MNKITDKIQTGTVGELLVQIRLLQYGVQAAPPIKDSGNDLIAVNRNEFRAVSVRTTTDADGKYNKPESDKLYHVLAVVHLAGDDRIVNLDASNIFLIPHAAVQAAPSQCKDLGKYVFTRQRLQELFGELQH